MTVKCSDTSIYVMVTTKNKYTYSLKLFESKQWIKPHTANCQYDTHDNLLINISHLVTVDNKMFRHYEKNEKIKNEQFKKYHHDVNRHTENVWILACTAIICQYDSHSKPEWRSQFKNQIFICRNLFYHKSSRRAKIFHVYNK